MNGGASLPKSTVQFLRSELQAVGDFFPLLPPPYQHLKYPFPLKPS